MGPVTQDMSPSSLYRRLTNRIRRGLSSGLAKRRYEMRNDKPYISFSFDDFPRSAVLTAGQILNRRGISGTYYASLGMMGQDSPTGRIFSQADLEQLLSEDHELGCHTFDHYHAWDTRPEEFEGSVLRNREMLEKIAPQAIFKTLSYPLSGPRPATKIVASRYFSCCRGGGQTFNEGVMDLNHLHGYFLEQNLDDPNSIKEMIDRNCLACGWLIFATHDVCEGPTRFGCPPGIFDDIVEYSVQSGATVLPVGRALEKISGAGNSGKTVGLDS